jgi:hypothetical protein
VCGQNSFKKAAWAKKETTPYEDNLFPLSFLNYRIRYFERLRKLTGLQKKALGKFDGGAIEKKCCLSPSCTSVFTILRASSYLFRPGSLDFFVSFFIKEKRNNPMYILVMRFKYLILLN